MQNQPKCDRSSSRLRLMSDAIFQFMSKARILGTNDSVGRRDATLCLDANIESVTGTLLRSAGDYVRKVSSE